MSDQPTLPGLTSATSSQESPGGPLPSNSPAGPTIGPYGQGVAHARASRRRASGAAATIPGICGPSSADSLQNASLLWSSASKSLPVTPSGRLQASLGAAIIRRLQPYGSMVYRQAWKVRATPSGFTFLAHTASARTTSGSGCTGWRTPKANESAEDVDSVTARRQLRRENGDTKTGNLLNLSQEAQLAGWPTASCRDAKGRTGQASQATQKAKGHERKILAETAELAGWRSPQSANATQGPKSDEHFQACQATNKSQITLTDQVAAFGPTSSSSPAGTERRGVLNPAFPLWLMGFPATWQHSCPGWKSWDTIQRLLAESSEKPDGTE